MLDDFLALMGTLFPPKFPSKKWRRTFLIRPRKSEYGNYVWGRCWKRDKLIPLPSGHPARDKMMTHSVVEVYVSNKQYFLEKLLNEHV